MAPTPNPGGCWVVANLLYVASAVLIAPLQGFWLVAAGMVAAQVCMAATPEERGAYLVQGPMGCGNCHTPMGPEGPMAGMDLAGTLILDQEGIKAYSANITPGGRVAQWSDAELAKAIREGRTPHYWTFVRKDTPWS